MLPISCISSQHHEMKITNEKFQDQESKRKPQNILIKNIFIILHFSAMKLSFGARRQWLTDMPCLYKG